MLMSRIVAKSAAIQNEKNKRRPLEDCFVCLVIGSAFSADLERYYKSFADWTAGPGTEGDAINPLARSV